MAEEARQILRDSLLPAAANPALLARDLFGPAHGIEPWTCLPVMWTLKITEEAICGPRA